MKWSAGDYYTEKLSVDLGYLCKKRVGKLSLSQERHSRPKTDAWGRDSTAEKPGNRGISLPHAWRWFSVSFSFLAPDHMPVAIEVPCSPAFRGTTRGRISNCLLEVWSLLFAASRGG